MTTEYLIPDLKRDEGLRLVAYPDPLTHDDPWTCGYGATGPDIHRGTIWTEAYAEQRLEADVARVERVLDSELPWWRNLTDFRQDALANACYNLGIGRLLGFHHALAALQAHDYDKAADEFIDSDWSGQVGARAYRVAQQIRTGDHAD